MPSPKYVGRLLVVEYSIADETATVGGLTWSRLGAMRGKTLSVTWDSVDATADTSPGNNKETLTTFLGIEFSGDGVAYGETVSGQKALRAHVMNPPVGTQYSPKAWLRLTEPDGSITVGPFMVTEFSAEFPHADVATWSLSSSSNGAVTYTPA
jgi:predicted secreted protein